jgi:hypothetical protein
VLASPHLPALPLFLHDLHSLHLGPHDRHAPKQSHVAAGLQLRQVPE